MTEQEIKMELRHDLELAQAQLIVAETAVAILGIMEKRQVGK